MLDTCTCIFLMKGSPASAREHLAGKLGDRVCLSSVVISELWFGVYNSQLMEKNKQVLKRFLQPFEELVYGFAANEAYGQQRAILKARGLPIGPLDMLIAAHALAEGATLVTNNLKEFSRIDGLQLQDWSQP